MERRIKSMPFTTEIVGAYGGVQFTGSDYTNEAVTQPLMNFFADAFAVANNAVGAPSAAQMQEDLKSLLNIAKNGISVQTDESGRSVTYYMTAQMVDSLNELLKSLQAGGLTDLPNITQPGLDAWKSMVQSGAKPYPELNFNQSLFNILYYAANNFGKNKVLLNTITTDNGPPITTGAQLIAALTKTGGNVTVSDYVARSLQAMTEVDYVNEGNQLINDTLTKMYTALSVTKTVIDDLTTLQNLHNELTIVGRQDNFTYERNDPISAKQFQDKYEDKIGTFTNTLIPQLTKEYSPWLFPGAEIHFENVETSSGGPNSTVVTVWVTIPGISDPLADRPYTLINPLTGDMMTIGSGQEIKIGGTMLLPLKPSEFVDTPEFKDKLAKLLAYQKPGEWSALSGSTNYSPIDPNNGNIWPLITKTSDGMALTDRLQAMKTALTQKVADLLAQAGTDTTSDDYKNIVNNEQSLYNLTKKVLEDIGDPTNYTATRQWIMDNYQSFNTPDATLAGAYQQNITSAITASQALNDTQKETVRNNLFLFEEFYKSASTVLTMLNQIITKMGQNIAR